MTDYQFLKILANKKQKNKKQKIKKGFQIFIKCNLKIVDYLHVTLNLKDVTYHPFHKPNDETSYIHVESYHTLQAVKKIARSVAKRLSRLSSTKEMIEN